MGTITLTDRFSVDILAENDTQLDSQKRSIGKSIANLLTNGGNADISDALADQLGATLKPIITDENGDNWASVADIIADGKTMQLNGAFEEKTIHEGITSGGTLYTIKEVYGPGNYQLAKNYRVSTVDGYFTFYGDSQSPDTIAKIIWFGLNTGGNNFWYRGGSGTGLTGEIVNVTLNGVLYKPYLTTQNLSGGMDTLTVTNLLNAGYKLGIDVHDYPADGYRDRKCVTGYLFGPVSTAGGSPIDWTKSDSEIESDLLQLQQTWNISEHEGSIEANGLYMLV